MHDMIFKYSSGETLIFDTESCHYYMDIPVLYNLETYVNKPIRFLFDTGAYVTVINKSTSLFFGFDKLSPVIEHFPLTGIAGSCDASLKMIPGMVIGGKIFKGIKVAIPHDDTKYCILGLNVIEYFKYIFDSEDNRIYISDNNNYKMPSELMSASVLNVSK